MSPRAPDKQEKAERVKSMVEEIKDILSKGETEIYALDESHFQPNRIWLEVGLKKGGRHKIETSYKRESLTFFECLNLVTQKFY